MYKKRKSIDTQLPADLNIKEIKELKTLKKAYIVWHSGMLSDNPNDGFIDIDEIPYVYAECPNNAKKLSREPWDWPYNDKDVTYIDLRVKRAKSADIVIFEDHEMKRGAALYLISERERISKRRAAVEKFPETSYFMVQNGYVGNSVLWWAKGSSGYTTDVDRAEIYSREEILKRFVDGREQDIIWEFNHIQEHIKTHVDGQYLSREFSA